MASTLATMASSSLLSPERPRSRESRQRAFSVSSHHSDLFDAGSQPMSTQASPDLRASQLPSIEQQVRRSSSSKRTLTDHKSSSMHPTLPLQAEDLPLTPSFGTDPFAYTARSRFEGLTAGEAEGLVSATTSRRPSAVGLQSPARAGSGERSPLRGPANNLRSRSTASSRRPSVDSPLGRVFAPQLVDHAMFLPLPQTDPLQTLLNKYVAPNLRPMRDMQGRWDGMTVQAMVSSCSWRCLATYARDTLVRTDPSDIRAILNLWHIRLHSLAMLHLHVQLYSEVTALFRQLSHLPLPADSIPFELEVIRAQARAYRPVEGPRDHLGAVEELGVLVATCRREARRGLGRSVLKDGTDDKRAMWRERAMRVGVVLAGVLIEIKDYPAAVALLAPLVDQPATPEILFHLLSIHLTAASLAPARQCLDALRSHPYASQPLQVLAQALFDSAEGNWARVVDGLRQLDAVENVGLEVVIVNNLAVGLVNDGKLHEATSALERLIERSPATALTEPVIFNLATLYELQAGSATVKKVALLLETAKWHGDGLKPGCFKLA